MSYSHMLFNVNKITVKPGLEKSYIEFSRALNEYLIKKYEKYFIGLQLYKSNEASNIFYSLASYNDLCDVDWMIKYVQQDINFKYDYTWGDSVNREVIFSFITSERILPVNISENCIDLT